MNKPFDLDHAVKHGCITRNGRKARIICTDAKLLGGETILALIDTGSTESYFSYFADGRAFKGRDYEYDLINTPVKHKQTHWYIGFLDGRIYGPCWSEASARDTARTLTSVAAIFPHEIEFTEGEGL